MYKLTLSDKISLNKKNIGFDTYSKIYAIFHGILAEYKVDIAFDMELDIEKKFYMSFYAINIDYLENFLAILFEKGLINNLNCSINNRLIDKMNIESSFTNIEPINIDNVSNFYIVKRTKFSRDKWTSSRLKNVIHFVLDNFDSDFRIGSRAYYIKKLIMKTVDFNIKNIDSYLVEYRNILSKNHNERYLNIHSSSSNQKFVLAFKKEFIDNPEIITFKTNSYGLSNDDSLFYIPVI